MLIYIIAFPVQKLLASFFTGHVLRTRSFKTPLRFVLKGAQTSASPVNANKI